jgi:hypothetical protein
VPVRPRDMSPGATTETSAIALSGGGKRFVVHADDKFTAFLGLERAICLRLLSEQTKS